MKISDLSPLNEKISYLAKVGPVLSEKFATAGINTIRDLLFYLPRRYGTIENCQTLAEVVSGQNARIKGIVTKKNCLRPPRRRPIYELHIEDGQGKLTARWFFRPFIMDNIQIGEEVILVGKAEFFRGRYQMIHPEICKVKAPGEAVDGDTNMLTYSELEGIPQSRLRKIIIQALPLAAKLPEPLPEELRLKRRMPTLAEAITFLQMPPPESNFEAFNKWQSPWHQRLIYDEFLALQLGLFKRRSQQKQQGAPLIGGGAGINAEKLARDLFPFALTAAQSRVIGEILDDMAQARPMNRLLHGDVGSGKTAVALLAAYVAMQAGYQVAIMAPTELLAQQHYAKAKEAFGELAPVELLLGHQKAAYKKRIQTDVATGRAFLVIGTHALIQEAVQFKKLGLVIIDEQHRFGVMQRVALLNKAAAAGGLTPHLLVMTATPIPRTMAMTVYGDLDVSTIDGMPPGRKPVETRLYKEDRREEMYQEIAAALEKGQQAYMIYPLVEESESELLAGIKNATSMAEELQNGPFKNFRVGLMHGRLEAKAKNEVMEAFHRHEIDLLISTTVVEVGIDVPQATILVVEHAERFGLSQLHQLRGRVGRGHEGGACILMLGGFAPDDAFRRMMVLCQESSGFKVAEADLEIRGPGDIIGTRQSGMPSLKYADLFRDQQILKAARQDAQKIIAYDPELRRFPGLKQMTEELWRDHLFLAMVG